MTSETYPSGRVVNTQYDGANRPIGVSGRIPAQQTTTNYVAGVSYAPHGGVASATWGNGISRTTQYNVRLQPSSLWDVLGGSGSAHLFTEDLNWGGGANDGTLQAVNTTGGTPTQLSFREDFWYDGVNRLKQVVDSGGWTRLFSYDQYGNMSLAWNSGAPLYGTTPQSNNGAYNPFNPATNQLSSANYDQAGNQTQNGSLQISLDAEGRQTNSQDVSTHVSTNYYYDHDGKRVVTQTINGPTVVYVYDALGQKVADYSTAASSSPCRTCYLSYDHLGSVRMVTDQNGNVMGMHDYLPFGEEIPAGWAGRGSQWGAFDNVAQKFTGQERDWQSGLDYFGARYYGSVLGRFTSPDAPLTDQDPSDPQSWNLYSYVRNNPLVNTDPTGQDCESQYDSDTNTFCTDATSHNAGLTDLEQFLLEDFLRQLQSVQTFTNGAQQVGQQALNWIGQPRDQGCVNAHTAASAGVGMAGGAVAGSLFGPADVATVPAAAAAGYVGGAAFGRIGGLISCMGSSGRPGGSSNQSGGVSGSAGNLKKLSPSEIRKLKVAGEDAERIKKEIVGSRGSLYDLFKTESGDIVVRLKSGAGEPQPTGLNIRNY